MRKTLMVNHSATSCRILFENKDGTYVVFVEKYTNDLKKVEFSYELSYSMFFEAMQAINYKRD